MAGTVRIGACDFPMAPPESIDTLVAPTPVAPARLAVRRRLGLIIEPTQPEARRAHRLAIAEADLALGNANESYAQALGTFRSLRFQLHFATTGEAPSPTDSLTPSLSAMLAAAVHPNAAPRVLEDLRDDLRACDAPACSAFRRAINAALAARAERERLARAALSAHPHLARRDFAHAALSRNDCAGAREAAADVHRLDPLDPLPLVIKAWCETPHEAPLSMELLSALRTEAVSESERDREPLPWDENGFRGWRGVLTIAGDSPAAVALRAWHDSHRRAPATCDQGRCERSWWHASISVSANRGRVTPSARRLLAAGNPLGASLSDLAFESGLSCEQRTQAVRGPEHGSTLTCLSEGRDARECWRRRSHADGNLFARALPRETRHASLVGRRALVGTRFEATAEFQLLVGSNDDEAARIESARGYVDAALLLSWRLLLHTGGPDEARRIATMDAIEIPDNRSEAELLLDAQLAASEAEALEAYRTTDRGDFVRAMILGLRTQNPVPRSEEERFAIERIAPARPPLSTVEVPVLGSYWPRQLIDPTRPALAALLASNTPLVFDGCTWPAPEETPSIAADTPHLIARARIVDLLRRRECPAAQRAVATVERVDPYDPLVGAVPMICALGLGDHTLPSRADSFGQNVETVDEWLTVLGDPREHDLGWYLDSALDPLFQGDPPPNATTAVRESFSAASYDRFCVGGLCERSPWFAAAAAVMAARTSWIPQPAPPRATRAVVRQHNPLGVAVIDAPFDRSLSCEERTAHIRGPLHLATLECLADGLDLSDCWTRVRMRALLEDCSRESEGPLDAAAFGDSIPMRADELVCLAELADGSAASARLLARYEGTPVAASDVWWHARIRQAVRAYDPGLPALLAQARPHLLPISRAYARYQVAVEDPDARLPDEDRRRAFLAVVHDAIPEDELAALEENGSE